MPNNETCGGNMWEGKRGRGDLPLLIIACPHRHHQSRKPSKARQRQLT